MHAYKLAISRPRVRASALKSGCYGTPLTKVAYAAPNLYRLPHVLPGRHCLYNGRTVLHGMVQRVEETGCLQVIVFNFLPAY
jgi:hypothetical protein